MEKPEPFTTQIDFTQFVADLDNGQVAIQLGEQLAKLVAAVQDTHGDGTLSVVFKVSDEGNGKAAVKTKSVLKAPTLPHYATIFFVHPKKGLSREDPRQQKLNFRDVPPAAPTPLRALNRAAATPRDIAAPPTPDTDPKKGEN